MYVEHESTHSEVLSVILKSNVFYVMFLDIVLLLLLLVNIIVVIVVMTVAPSVEKTKTWLFPQMFIGATQTTKTTTTTTTFFCNKYNYIKI